VEKPGERIRVLIVDDVAETRENLRKLLSFAPEIEVVATAATGEEGVQLARETQPHVVLMDINLPGIDGITATEQIVRDVPTAQIVILSVQGETGYMRRAMAAGARDYLVKPPSGDELIGAIRRAYEIGKVQAARIALPTAARPVPGAEPPSRRGQLITVFAPKGGVGCTTVAVNLAIALQERVGVEKKVALIDGSLQFGDVGVMLNLQANRSIADLAGRMEELDADLLTSVLTPHPSGIKALLAPPHPEAAESLRTAEAGEEGAGQKIRTVVSKMLEQFDLVVADTWSWIDDVTLALLDEATFVLVLLTPMIPAVKSARLFLDLARQLGYPDEKIGVVINHADRRTGLRVDQVERALVPAVGYIPFDERAGISAANRGVPLITQERGKPLSRSFAQLAQAVLDRLEQLAQEGEDEEWADVEISRRLLGRIL